MAGNSWKSTTGVYVCDSTGNLSTVGVTVIKVVYVPATQAHNFILTDTSDNTAIALKANSGNTDMVEIDFGRRGRKLPSLKVGTIDGGVAYVYYRIM